MLRYLWMSLNKPSVLKNNSLLLFFLLIEKFVQLVFILFQTMRRKCTGAFQCTSPLNHFSNFRLSSFAQNRENICITKGHDSKWNHKLSHHHYHSVSSPGFCWFPFLCAKVPADVFFLNIARWSSTGVKNNWPCTPSFACWMHTEVWQQTKESREEQWWEMPPAGTVVCCVAVQQVYTCPRQLRLGWRYTQIYWYLKNITGEQKSNTPYYLGCMVSNGKGGFQNTSFCKRSWWVWWEGKVCTSYSHLLPNSVWRCFERSEMQNLCPIAHFVILPLIFSWTGVHIPQLPPLFPEVTF